MTEETFEMKPDFREECVENGLDLEGWKVYFFTSNNKQFTNDWGTFYIIKKPLSEEETLPSLVAIAGFSVKSFSGTTNRIIQNLDKIKSKFKDVWVLCFTEQVKGMQSKACKEREATGSYNSEIELNEEIGVVVNKLLKATKLTNIHLLGKCAGGGVAIHTFTKDDNKYNALYLGVPASPVDVQHLLTKTWTGKKFIFAWDKRDAYAFSWGPSNQELSKYQKTMDKLKGSNNTIILNEFGVGEEHEKYFHEVPRELFDLL